MHSERPGRYKTLSTLFHFLDLETRKKAQLLAMQLVRADASMTLGHGSQVWPLQSIQRPAEPLTQALGSSTLLILVSHVLNYEPHLYWGRFDCEGLQNIAQLGLWQWH